jgi:hypothetical protein
MKTKSVLRAAALVTILGGAVPVAAADPKSGTSTQKQKTVYQQKIGDAYVSAAFNVNRDLGRAWVEVSASPWVDNPQRDVVARQMVKGLYYDPDRKAVIYWHKGQETVCAEDWKFLLSTSLKTTGNCELQVAMKDKPVDDGYTNMKEQVTTVTLVAHNLKPAPKTAKGPTGVMEMIVITPDES